MRELYGNIPILLHCFCSFIVNTVIHCGISHKIGMKNKLRTLKGTKSLQLWQSEKKKREESEIEKETTNTLKP